VAIEKVVIFFVITFGETEGDAEGDRSTNPS
jgi:hypothetical protein